MSESCEGQKALKVRKFRKPVDFVQTRAFYIAVVIENCGFICVMISLISEVYSNVTPANCRLIRLYIPVIQAF